MASSSSQWLGLRSPRLSGDDVAVPSARAQLSYVLRRSCCYSVHRLLCSRSQLQSKMHQYEHVIVPMRRAMFLGTCVIASAMGRMQSSLSSSGGLFSAFPGNQSQTGSGSLFDGTSNWKGPHDRSPCTGALLISYLVTHWAQFNTKERLLYLGAKINSLISRGQIWRLLTASFLHGNVLHLMLNYQSLNSVGPEVEKFYGSHQFLGIYFTSALSGSMMSYLFEPRMSVGASGAIFGLIGASWVYVWRHRKVLDQAKEYLIGLSIVIAINMAVGLMLRRYIDNWAHVGGLLGGAAFSWHCPADDIKTTDGPVRLF